MSEVNLPKWVKKALGTLNLSEEGKIINFYDFAVKEYQKGISSREKALVKLKTEYEEELERQNEILIEKTEDLQIISTSININSIDKRVDREKYFVQFDEIFSEALMEVQNQKDFISSITEKYENSVKQLKAEIEIFKTKLIYFED